MNVERKMASLLFATAGILSCGEVPSTSESVDTAYSKFVVNVNKTDSHGAYQVHNGIIDPANNGKEGIKNATLKFCDSETGVLKEVHISDTDFIERDRAIVEKEINHEISPQPFYTAIRGSKSCQLITKDGRVLIAIGFPR